MDSIKNWLVRLASLYKDSTPDSKMRARDGARAETLAADYLKAQGLYILERNYRVKGGELDLIALDGDSAVFVEVRLRRSAAFGGALASITPAKQRRLILAARCWLRHSGRRGNSRFDCVLLDQLSPDRIEWIKNAFSAD
ncbi:MAG: YraN family protein [Zoogloeaceae bacterium]|jgi:putative endonuclease|nr:YraN family protein [Zoogloeaceae bacterium]